MTIKALPYVDRLERDGRTLLLLEHRVIELSPLALATYDAAVDGITRRALIDTLVASFGAPPDDDPADAVQTIIDELVTLNLVTVD